MLDCDLCTHPTSLAQFDFSRDYSRERSVYLQVENNSKFVRGKKKAREDIERYVLEYYHMEKPHKDRGEYILSIPYDTEEELEKTIYDILGETSSTADLRHCFIEADVVSMDDPDKSW